MTTKGAEQVRYQQIVHLLTGKSLYLPVASMASEATKFQETLETKLHDFSLRGNYEYSSVVVLLLSWKEDTLGVQDEIRRVSIMFREVFAYNVQEYLIPSVNPEISLATEIHSLVERHGGEDSLIIIYYGGHGDPDLDGERQAIWAAYFFP